MVVAVIFCIFAIPWEKVRGWFDRESTVVPTVDKRPNVRQARNRGYVTITLEPGDEPKVFDLSGSRNEIAWFPDDATYFKRYTRPNGKIWKPKEADKNGWIPGNVVYLKGESRPTAKFELMVPNHASPMAKRLKKGPRTVELEVWHR